MGDCRTDNISIVKLHLGHWSFTYMQHSCNVSEYVFYALACVLFWRWAWSLTPWETVAGMMLKTAYGTVQVFRRAYEAVGLGWVYAITK